MQNGRYIDEEDEIESWMAADEMFGFAIERYQHFLIKREKKNETIPQIKGQCTILAIITGFVQSVVVRIPIRNLWQIVPLLFFTITNVNGRWVDSMFHCCLLVR